MSIKTILTRNMTDYNIDDGIDKTDEKIREINNTIAIIAIQILNIYTKFEIDIFRRLMGFIKITSEINDIVFEQMIETRLLDLLNNTEIQITNTEYDQIKSIIVVNRQHLQQLFANSPYIVNIINNKVYISTKIICISI